MASTHRETAEKAAKKVFEVIERNGRIVMGDIVEAIESVLALQVSPAQAAVPTTTNVPHIYSYTQGGGGGTGGTWGSGGGGGSTLPVFARDAIDRMRIADLLQQHLDNHPGAILSCGNE